MSWSEIHFLNLLSDVLYKINYCKKFTNATHIINFITIWNDINFLLFLKRKIYFFTYCLCVLLFWNASWYLKIVLKCILSIRIPFSLWMNKFILKGIYWIRNNKKLLLYSCSKVYFQRAEVVNNSDRRIFINDITDYFETLWFSDKLNVQDTHTHAHTLRSIRYAIA